MQEAARWRRERESLVVHDKATDYISVERGVKGKKRKCMREKGKQS